MTAGRPAGGVAGRWLGCCVGVALAAVLGCGAPEVASSGESVSTEREAVRSGLEPLPAPPPRTLADADPTDADRLAVRHARRFGFEPSADGLVLWVREPWREAGDGLRYLLVPRGSNDREAAGVRESYEAVIEVPVGRLATTSTTELGHLVTLGLESLWAAHAEPRYVCSPSLRARIDEGAIVDIASGPGRIDPETLLAARPDVLLADFMSRDQLEALEPVRAAGVAIVLAPAFLEPSPLGRAEWVRVLGALGGRTPESAAVFARVEAAYEAVRVRAAAAVDGPRDAPGARPLAVTGGPYDGVWHVPGGDSYPARLLADAGAVTPWSDVRDERALPLDLEAVIDRAASADLWLWPSHWRSRQEIRAADPRLEAFSALGAGDVWAADRRTNASGGNDFWESGAARPDLVLADLLQIVHPLHLPDHRQVYHRRLDDPLERSAGTP